VKEARYAKQQQQQQEPDQEQQQSVAVEEIKSLEQFRFEGSTFLFTYQFWRGNTLLHSFEIEAGTFFIAEDDDNNTDNTSTQHSTSSTTSHYADDTSVTMSATSSSSRQRRVVLRWPSPVYYPLLQTWRFHQTYSHFLLHEPTAAPSSPMDVATSSAPSSHPSSPLAPPSCSASACAGRPCLISRLGSVFVQDE
jgi:hypothetical protein